MASAGKSEGTSGRPGPAGRGPLADGFLFGVATAGFQIEGGFNGPGQPANNWLAWEQTGRVTPSGDAVDFWRRPEEALDRAAALGCDSFRLGVEWARVQPDGTGVDQVALDRYVAITEACVERGLTPLVTLHHFTHPQWLGEDLWLRPDAVARFEAWARVVVPALAPTVRHWVTLNEINVMALMTYLLGAFPPGRLGGIGDTAVALDSMLAAHVRAYDVIHAQRPDAVVTTNNFCMTVYEYDRMLLDVLLSRSMGIDRPDLDGWIDERRRGHYGMLPSPGVGEALLRRAGCRRRPLRLERTPWRRAAPRARCHRGQPARADPRRPGRRLLRPAGLAALPAARPPHRRRSQSAARPRAVGRPAGPGGPDPLAGRPGRAHPRPAPVGRGERALQPAAQRALARSARRLGPTPLPAGQRGGRGRRRRRRRAGRGLLALVAGRQLRVGVLRAPLRHPRRGPRPRRAGRDVARDRRHGSGRRRRLPLDHLGPAGRRPLGAAPG